MSARTATPHGWSLAAVKNVCTFSRGVSWKKSQERRDPTRDSTPVLRIPNVQDTLRLTDVIYIDGVTKDQQEKARVREGCTLLVGSNGNPKRVGNCVYVAEPRNFLFASFLIGARPSSRQIDGEFLYRLLSSRPVQNEIWNSVQGSTGLRNIDLNALRSLRVLVPPLVEQRKIALVLSSMDEAIGKTRAVIDQLQVVKRSLVQELLTQGLPKRHTRFKPTEIGLVPEGWSVRPLGDYVEHGPDNGLYRPQSDYGDGTPIVRIDAFNNGDVLRRPVLRRVSIEPREVARFRVTPGNILINRVNSLSHLAKCALADSFEEPTVYESNMMRLSLDDSRLMSQFGFLWLSSEHAKKHLRRKAKRAVAQASINQDDVMTVPTPCPPRDEQRRIVQISAGVDERLESENRELAAVRDLKSALMSVLLTGELRVTPDPEPE